MNICLTAIFYKLINQPDSSGGQSLDESLHRPDDNMDDFDDK